MVGVRKDNRETSWPDVSSTAVGDVTHAFAWLDFAWWSHSGTAQDRIDPEVDQ